jgi:hypothetical protein
MRLYFRGLNSHWDASADSRMKGRNLSTLSEPLKTLKTPVLISA